MNRVILAVCSTILLTGACAATPEANPEPTIEGPSLEDRCPVEDYRYLVGRNRSEIPERPPGAVWRVVCSTCAVTMDYRPDRLNIVYHTETEVVTEVKCG